MLAYSQPSHSLRYPGVVFRATRDEDRPFLEALFFTTRLDELAHAPWPTEQKLAFLRQQYALQDHHYRTHYSGAAFLLLALDACPIGRLYLYRSANDLRLMDIALMPEHRGRGIGSALLAELTDESESRGIPISLHVEPHNPAKRLYQRLGFLTRDTSGLYQYMERPVGASLQPANEAEDAVVSDLS